MKNNAIWLEKKTHRPWFQQWQQENMQRRRGWRGYDRGVKWMKLKRSSLCSVVMVYSNCSLQREEKQTRKDRIVQGNENEMRWPKRAGVLDLGPSQYISLKVSQLRRTGVGRVMSVMIQTNKEQRKQGSCRKLAYFIITHHGDNNDELFLPSLSPLSNMRACSSPLDGDCPWW